MIALENIHTPLQPIPIANLLRIVFYAGSLLDELDDCVATHEPGVTFEELLQSLFAGAAERIHSRGFERGYSTECEITARPHGRVVLAESIAQCTLRLRRLVCNFDEFSIDTPHNRVLKATARALSRPSAPETHADELRRLVREMREVPDVALNRRLLAALPRSITTRRYRVVRFIAKLLVEQGQPDEMDGESWARSLLRDEVRLRRIFERFVHRFAGAHKPSGVRVGRSTLTWSSHATSTAPLPRLVTDLTIQSSHHTRIIECKYTPKVLERPPHGKLTFRSDHLRQLFAYLSRTQAKNPQCAIDGVLLYPTLAPDLHATFNLGGIAASVAGVQLEEPWSTLQQRLEQTLFGTAMGQLKRLCLAST